MLPTLDFLFFCSLSVSFLEYYNGYMAIYIFPEVDSNKINLLEYCTEVHLLIICTLLEYYFFLLL